MKTWNLRDEVWIVVAEPTDTYHDCSACKARVKETVWTCRAVRARVVGINQQEYVSGPQDRKRTSYTLQALERINSMAEQVRWEGDVNEVGDGKADKVYRTQAEAAAAAEEYVRTLGIDRVRCEESYGGKEDGDEGE